MLKEILEGLSGKDKKEVESALGNVMEIIAADVMGSGGFLPEAAIDNFDTWFDGEPAVADKWNSMSYKEKMTMSKKIAKQYV